MTRGQGGVELDVPILADEVVRADLREDEVEDALGEPAHQLDGELVGDEEVAVGQHVREAGVQGLVLRSVVVVVPQDVGNLDIVIVFLDYIRRYGYLGFALGFRIDIPNHCITNGSIMFQVWEDEI